MKTLATLLIFLIVAANIAVADEAINRPMHDRLPLVPLEVLVSFSETLEISDQKIAEFRERMQAMRRETRNKGANLRSEMRVMQQILRATPIDAEAARKQLDRVLALEAEIKHLRVGELVWLNNQLNPQQLATARSLHEDVREGRVQRRMRDMVRRVKRAARTMADRGHPPVEVKRRMQEVEALIDAGKVEEAEKMLRDILNYAESR